MEGVREYVSADTLQRAIRAQLIRDNGVETDYVLIPFTVELQNARESVDNWSLVLEAEASAPAQSLDAVRIAAATIAMRYQLERRRTPWPA